MVAIKTKMAHRNNYGNQRDVSQIEYLVIHYTSNDGDTDEGNGNYFANNIVKASAHYFVDDDSITQAVPDNYVAWAVGGTKYPSCSYTGGGKFYGICTNTNSISIEICDDVKNGVVYPSAKTIENALDLARMIMKQYNIPKERVIRHFDVTGKLCLPCDSTELLTKSGWVRLDEISVGDIVAQYNPSDDSIAFAEAQDTVEPYSAIVHKSRALEATSNHRMWLKPNCQNSKEFREVRFGDALQGRRHYVIKNGAMYHGSGLFGISNDQLRLLAWIQGDGHYMKNKGGNVVGLEFHLKKDRKIERVIDLLDTLNVSYTLSSKQDGSMSIRHHGTDVIEWAERWLFNKQFDYNLLEMTKEQFDVFWNELLEVDGNRQKNLYASAVQQNLDVVQALCATKGVRTNKCTMGSKNPSAVMRTDANYVLGGETDKERETMVSCVTVPSGYILIRQHGKTFIVGNCPAYWCGDAFNDKLWKTEFWDKLDVVDSQEEIEVRYNTVAECPKWAQPTIQKLIDEEFLNGDGNGLDLSYDMVRMLVILDRAGMFD